VLSTNLTLQWLSNAFGHLMKLPLSYFEKRHTGDVVSLARQNGLVTSSSAPFGGRTGPVNRRQGGACMLVGKSYTCS
jgi:hypothetical protein